MNANLVLSSLVILSLSACQFAVGSGKLVSESREVGPFKKLDIASGIDTHATIGTRSVSILADDNVLPLIQTFVTGDTLHVRLAPNTIPPVGSTLSVDISNDLFEGIEASGGATVDATATPTTSFRLVASGGSDIVLTGLATTELDLDASGGSTINLAGAATRATAISSGGSGLKLRAIPVEALAVDVSGGSTVAARVSSSLTGSASGGSTVSIVGRPDNRLEVSGGSVLHLNVE